MRGLNTTPIFIQYNSEYIDDYGVWKVLLSELNSVREHSMLDKDSRSFIPFIGVYMLINDVQVAPEDVLILDTETTGLSYKD